MFAQTLVQIASAIAGQFRRRFLVSLPLSLAALWCLLSLPALTPPALAQGGVVTYKATIGAPNPIQPFGVAVDNQGDIYIADWPNQRIQKFDSNGNLLWTYGGSGWRWHGSGPLFNPQSVAVDNAGNVYVGDDYHISKVNSSGEFTGYIGDGDVSSVLSIAVDSNGDVYAVNDYLNCIQKFDSGGGLLWKVGGDNPGAEDGKFFFNGRGGIAVDASGSVYVCDSGNNRIQSFDSNGNFVAKTSSYFNSNGPIQAAPYQITVDNAGYLYVSNTDRSVLKLDQGFNVLASFGSPGPPSYDFGSLSNPSGVAVDGNGNVYIADYDGRIQKFDGGGNFLVVIGAIGAGNDHLAHPENVTTDGAGNIYVADSGNNRIQKFDHSRQLLWTVGGDGSNDYHAGRLNGQFNNLSSIAVDSSGNVLAGDYGGRIQKFDANGNYISQFLPPLPDTDNRSIQSLATDISGNVYVSELYFANYGSAETRLVKYDGNGNLVATLLSGSYPAVSIVAMTVDSAGNIYLSTMDPVSQVTTVKKMDSDGNIVLTFGSYGFGPGQFYRITALAVDSTGNIYVCDNGRNDFQKFDPSGRFISAFGKFGTGNDGFEYPSGIAVDGAGDIYVADWYNCRIQIFVQSSPITPNPVPALTSVTPNQASVGDPDTVITVNGSGFVSSSMVLLDGGALATTYVSLGQMTAVIPASQLAVAGSHTITVTSPTPGGGTSAALPFTVVNPAPQLTTLTPDHTAVNSPDTTISLTGMGFFSGSIVKFGATALTTTFVSSTQLTAVIPAASLTTVASTNVTVTNPAPGGGVSNALPFATTVNPVPVLNSLTPSQVIAGSPDTIITLSGSGFVPASIAKFGTVSLTTTFVSSTQLTALVPVAKLTTVGRVNVTVANPKPGGGVSKSRTFTVANPTPTLTNITPDEALAGSGNTTITLTGTGFIAASKVLLSGSALTTIYVSATTLTAVIPASKLTKAGDFDVTVSNLTPGGGTSGSLTLTVSNPAPTLTGITPNQATENATGVTITLNGSGFVSGAKATFGGTALTTTFVSSTQLRASVSSTLLKPGIYDVIVANPAPGGGDTVALPFTVNMGATTLTLISSPAPTVTKSGGVLTVRATLKNPGSYDARNVRVTAATLNGTTSAIISPSATITITKGASTVITLTFPASAATSGSYPALA